MPTTFGQIVIGPPGAGKTTYCDFMSQLLRGLGRKVAILNIDPANEGETLPYKGIQKIIKEIITHIALGLTLLNYVNPPNFITLLFISS